MGLPVGCAIDAWSAGLIFACNTPLKRYINLCILKKVILQTGGEFGSFL